MKSRFFKILKAAMLVTALSVIAVTLGSCKKPDNPNKPDNPGSSKLHVMVASYRNNAVFDGKLAVNAENEYAVVEYGKAPVSENLIVYTADFAIHDMIGVPAEYKVSDGVITEVKTVDEKPLILKNSDDIVEQSSTFNADAEKYYFSFDGWSVKGVKPEGMYAFNQKSDDEIILYDIDGDGKYDFANYKPLYNGVEVTAVGSNNVTLKGGYGSAALPEALSSGSSFYIKKSLSTKLPKEGSIINVTIRIDGESTQLYNDIPVAFTYNSDAETMSAPLAAAIYNNKTDIMNRVNGDVCYWSSAYSDAEMGSGRDTADKNSIGVPFKFVYDTEGNIVCTKKITIDDIDFEALVGGTSFESENGTMVSGTLDPQAMWHRTTSYSTVQKYVSLLRQMGLRRVYVVVSNDGYPMFASSKNGYSSRQKFDDAITYFQSLGFELPDHSFVKACHDMGMECYAIYKIYEGGGGATAPLGAEVGYNQSYVEDIFGRRLGFETYLQEGFKAGKDYRIVRRDDGVNDNIDGNIDKIRIEFLTDGYEFRGNSDERANVRTAKPVVAASVKLIADGKTYTNEDQHRMYGINLWVSENNGQYKLYSGDYEYKYVKDKMVIKDANGDPMFDGQEKEVVALEITGIGIKDNFCAVTFNSTTNLRLNIYSMTHLYVGGKEIASSTTRYVRWMYQDYGNDAKPEEYVWGFENYPASAFYCEYMRLDDKGNIDYKARNEDVAEEALAATKFMKYGFEFNWYPYGEEISVSNSVIPLARGKVETFPGGACEGYEEVRAAWLSHVETLLKGGFDGVEIRLQSHSSMSADYKNYGYNEPIVERYKELYGQAAYNTLLDPAHHVTDEEYLKIMAIRGEFVMMFLEKASALCKDYGAEFSVNLRAAYIDPIASHCKNEASWWTMPKVTLDWKKCVDLSTYVSFKDYITEANVIINGKEIKDYAYAQGKEVWVQCYDEQAGALNSDFFNAANGDPTISGFVIYELSAVESYSQNGLGKTLSQAGYSVVSKADELESKCK